ncbi:MAG: hypothetical protein Q4A59_01820 [Erysipelotrichaceae bacterium]|nr:hypothetical protein [Erysipelotrichaceae bacterium]
MKLYAKQSLALLMATSVFVGCQSQNTNQNSISTAAASSTAPVESTVTSAISNDLLNQLLLANHDDQQAKEIWTKLLKQTVDYHHGKVETNSEIQLYDYKGDDITSNTPDHLIEEIDRKSGMIVRSGDILAMSNMEMDDDSQSTLLNLYGKYARVSSSRSTAVKALLDHEQAHFDEGLITDINEDTYSQDTYAQVFLQENLMNGGYLRSVDPIQNASLYVYDCIETEDGFELTATIRSVLDYQNKAKRTMVSEDENQTQTLIALDEATKEQYVFEFNRDGILEELTNDMFKARINKDKKTYVNLHQEIEIEDFDEDEHLEQELDRLMQMIESRKLESGSAFDVPSWD